MKVSSIIIFIITIVLILVNLNQLPNFSVGYATSQNQTDNSLSKPLETSTSLSNPNTQLLIYQISEKVTQLDPTARLDSIKNAVERLALQTENKGGNVEAALTKVLDQLSTNIHSNIGKTLLNLAKNEKGTNLPPPNSQISQNNNILNQQSSKSEGTNQTNSPVLIEKNISQIISKNIIPSTMILSIGNEKKLHQFVELRQIEFARSNDSIDSSLQSYSNTNLENNNVTNNPQFKFNVTNWPPIAYDQIINVDNQNNLSKNNFTPKLQLTKVMNPSEVTSYNTADTGPQIMMEIPPQIDRISNSSYFSITDMIPQGHYLVDILIDYSDNYNTPYNATYTGKILVTANLAESSTVNNQNSERVFAERGSNDDKGDDPDNGRDGGDDPDNGRDGGDDPDNGRDGDIKDCLFDSSLPQCAPTDEGCPEGTFDNEDGQCIPDTGCPDGYTTLEDDESGECVPEDESSDTDSSEPEPLDDMMRAFK